MRPLSTENKTKDTKARHGSIHISGGIVDCLPIARICPDREQLRRQGEVTGNQPTVLFIVYSWTDTASLSELWPTLSLE
jgi:hypothetical protein